MYFLVYLVAVSLCSVSFCNGDCKKILSSGVDATASNAIVKKHNELRAKVANGKEGSLPKAANMLEMVWDDAVAKKAQEWANKCKFAHDDAKDRDTGNGYTGQNIAWASNQDNKPNWDRVIQNFYDEVKNFSSNSIDKYVSQSSTGHFTQVIWAKTYKVGCGYVRHEERGNSVHLYGCNYLPGGNIISEHIYENGEPCSKCGGCGTIPGLCVAGSKTLSGSPAIGTRNFGNLFGGGIFRGLF